MRKSDVVLIVVVGIMVVILLLRRKPVTALPEEEIPEPTEALPGTPEWKKYWEKFEEYFRTHF